MYGQYDNVQSRISTGDGYDVKASADRDVHKEQ